MSPWRGTAGRAVLHLSILGVTGLAACDEAVAPPALDVALFVEPSQAPAVLMTGANAGNAECRYTLEARSFGGTMSEIDWLDSRSTFQHAYGVDTTRVSAERRVGFWTDRRPREHRAEWGWGGPIPVLPLTITETFFFRRHEDQARDSVSYTFVCLAPEIPAQAQ